MLGLRALFAAVARVTAAVNGIATTAEEVNARWRDQLHLDGPAEVENAPVLTDSSAPMPIATPTGPSGEPDVSNPPVPRNGRRKPVASV